MNIFPYHTIKFKKKDQICLKIDIMVMHVQIQEKT